MYIYIYIYTYKYIYTHIAARLGKCHRGSGKTLETSTKHPLGNAAKIRNDFAVPAILFLGGTKGVPRKGI